jgi:hypothetical protein
MGNAYLNMSKRHNNHPLLVVILRHNWRIDKKRLKYRAAFVRFWKNCIADKS